MNFHTLDDQLEFQLDAFDFDGRDPNNNFLSPRVRISTLFEFYNHLWIQGGWDDPLNTELQTWYLGGMLRFNDEDLKTIMSIAPSPFETIKTTRSMVLISRTSLDLSNGKCAG